MRTARTYRQLSARACKARKDRQSCAQACVVRWLGQSAALEHMARSPEQKDAEERTGTKADHEMLDQWAEMPEQLAEIPRQSAEIPYQAEMAPQTPSAYQAAMCRPTLTAAWRMRGSG